MILSAGYAALDSVVFDGKVSHHAGGTAANVAAILSWLGWGSFLAAVVGSDSAGDRFVADLRRAGVSRDALQRPTGAQTPQVMHHINDGTHHFSFSCPQCGRRFPRSRPLSAGHAEDVLDQLEAVDVFFFDRANPGTLALAERFRERRTLVVFEPSVVSSRDSLRTAADLAHIVKFSDDRLPVLWSELPPPNSNQAQIVTRGENGAAIRIGDRPWSERAALRTDAVDPGGAGDWTTAGLLYRLRGTTQLKKRGLVDALEFGQALAALNCEWPGARGLAARRRRADVLRDARRLLSDRPRASTPAPGRRRVARADEACAACLGPRRRASAGRQAVRSRKKLGRSAGRQNGAKKTRG